MVKTAGKLKKKHAGGRPQTAIARAIDQHQAKLVKFVVDEEIEDLICQRFVEGINLTIIVDALGYNRDSFYGLLKSDTPEGQRLRNKLARARQLLAIQNLHYIKQQRDEDWRAGAWMIEKCLPDEYGKPTVVQVNTGSERRVEISGPIIDV